MPCYITGSSEGDQRLYAEEARKKAQHLTQMLCETCRRLEREGSLYILGSEIASWWIEHKKTDQKNE